jgi:hypothetical protein
VARPFRGASGGLSLAREASQGSACTLGISGGAPHPSPGKGRRGSSSGWKANGDWPGDIGHELTSWRMGGNTKLWGNLFHTAVVVASEPYSQFKIAMHLKTIVEHIRSAQALAAEMGIPNILQPGIVKELMLADLLGHNVIPDKANADARDQDGNLYEYLCSLKTSNNFQIDRVTDENLHRITRNAAVFCAFFSDSTTIHQVYRLETAVVLNEVKRQLAASQNQISHLNLAGRWVRSNGTLVYPQ